MYNHTQQNFPETGQLKKRDAIGGDYVRYQYIYEIGPDPNMYWEHTFFQMATVNGQEVGSACYATFSPKKEPGQFQD